MPEVPKIVHERLRNLGRAGIPAPHPDPDVLAAFAEQALLPAEREQVLGHLAMCEDCRAAVLVALPPMESVAVPQLAAESSATAGSPRTNWFSQLAFAWPTLRWAALAAGVIVAGTVLLHYSGNSNQPVAFKQPSESKTQVANVPAPAASTTGADAVSRERDNFLADQKTAEIATKLSPKVSAQKQAVLKANDAESKDAESRSETVANKKLPSTASPAPNATVANSVSGKPAAPAAPAAREKVEVSGAVAEVQTQDRTFANGNRLSSAETNLPVMGRNVATLSARNEAAAPISKAKPATAAQQAAPMQMAKAAREGGASVQNFDALEQAAQFAGVVGDPSGAAVSNARVTVKNQGTGSITSTTTDQSGAYTIKELPAGTYKLTAEASGFKTVSDADVPLNAGVTARVDFKMPLGQATEVVEVTEAAQAFQAEDTKLRRTIGSAKWSLSSGMLRRSINGGTTWQTSLPDGRLLCYAPRGNDVWAGGKSGLLYHSADNGATWIQLHPVIGDKALASDVTHIEASSATAIVLTTSNGETWSSPDNGKSWTSK